MASEMYRRELRIRSVVSDWFLFLVYFYFLIDLIDCFHIIG